MKIKIIKKSKIPASSKYTKGFAKLKITTYYPISREWVLAITKTWKH